MKSRDLPDVVKATFGGGSPLRVKSLTPDISVTLLQDQHSHYWRVFQPFRAPDLAHSILRFASRNYYFKSQLPDPDPSLSGGLGQH